MTKYTFARDEPQHLTHSVLKHALETLRDPARWTQGEYARNAKGDGLENPKASSAVCFCSQGAILRAPHADVAVEYPFGRVFHVFYKVYGVVQTVIGGTNISAWNDAPERTHAEVLAVFEKAIEMTSELTPAAAEHEVTRDADADDACEGSDAKP